MYKLQKITRDDSYQSPNTHSDIQLTCKPGTAEDFFRDNSIIRNRGENSENNNNETNNMDLARTRFSKFNRSMHKATTGHKTFKTVPHLLTNNFADFRRLLPKFLELVFQVFTSLFVVNLIFADLCRKYLRSVTSWRIIHPSRRFKSRNGGRTTFSNFPGRDRSRLL